MTAATKRLPWIAMDFVGGADAQRLLADRYPAGMPTDELAALLTAAPALWTTHKRRRLTSTPTG